MYHFNLGWGLEPKRTSVLKTLIALPQTFNLRDLYNSSKQPSQDYVIRGMICFSEGGHYLSFFRRILIKIANLVDITLPDRHLNLEMRKFEKDITPQTEWIQYNDTELKYVPDNWPGVIERCIENNFYPTVVFYEKLHAEKDDVPYTESNHFSMTRNKLSDLASLAAELDHLASASVEEIYGQDQIEEQRKMMEEFERSNKKNTGDDMPQNPLASMQSSA